MFSAATQLLPPDCILGLILPYRCLRVEIESLPGDDWCDSIILHFYLIIRYYLSIITCLNNFISIALLT